MPLYKNIIKLVSVLALSFALAACGSSSSSEEKVVDQHNELAQQINTMGVPSTTWSEATLRDYISKLNRLEQLNKANSTDGVYGGHGNDRKIQAKRSYAQKMLNAKIKAKSDAAQIATLRSDAANFFEDVGVYAEKCIDPNSISEKESCLKQVDQLIDQSKSLEHLTNSASSLSRSYRSKILTALESTRETLRNTRDSLLEEPAQKVLTESEIKELGVEIIKDFSLLAGEYDQLSEMNEKSLIAHKDALESVKAKISIFNHSVLNGDFSTDKKERFTLLIGGLNTQMESVTAEVNKYIAEIDVEKVTKHEVLSKNETKELGMEIVSDLAGLAPEYSKLGEMNAEQLEEHKRKLDTIKTKTGAFEYSVLNGDFTAEQKNKFTVLMQGFNQQIDIAEKGVNKHTLNAAE